MHVELRHGSVIEQASNSLLQHAPRSSNLAAFSMHMTRMLRDLRLPSSAGTEQQSAVADFSNRIAMVGKARATAGSLNLFRLLVHAAIVRASSSACESESSSSSDYVKEAFTYKNRDSNTQNDTANDFVRALMEFIIISSSDDGNNKVPELYDATVLALQVVLILLSSQLYTPMISSFQRNQQSPTVRFFWDTLFQQASQSASENNWKPRSLLKALLDNSINRPAAPERSITFHNSELAKQVVQAKGEKLGEDGMYDSHVVISACAPMHLETNPETGSDELVKNGPTQRHNIIFDATKGVLRISSSIILLPFRLVSLVLGVWGNREKGYDNLHRKQICASLAQGQSLTKDVLWLTESPVADLSSCLLLLLSNNERNTLNPFRDELAHLTDNRWESDDHGLPDLPDLKWGTSALTDKQNDETAPLFVQLNTTLDQSLDTDKIVLQVNFEALFEAFGKIVHNEVGALLLYTIMQSSRSFADAIAVRSDLDTLVLPLLRTLYMSSSLRHFAAVDFSTRAKGRPTNGVVNSSEVHEAMSIRSCPFRSQSQLYTIMILLLLFSQDNSFGSDAFRRVMVANVPWYKERYLKEISLGSVLLLSLLRALTFNLNRLQDAFLLSNSCAILMNLSASVSDLHEYAAMRLASVTVSSIKRYVEFSKMNPNIDEDDLSSPTAMHGEVCRTLVRVVKECLSSKSIERNMHLVYALVYHQAEFMRAIKSQGKLVHQHEIQVDVVQ
jgi:hypothetical protein